MLLCGGLERRRLYRTALQVNGGVIAPRLDSLQYSTCLTESGVERDILAEGTMNGTQITPSNKLLEFEEMDMASHSRLGCVQDHE